MKPVTINNVNAIVLLIAGLYGYFGVAAADGHHSPTALIPAAFGVLFIILGQFWARAPKVVSHVIVVLTLVLLIMCLLRFVKVADWDAKKFIFLACVLSNAIALAVFIKSFIDARKNRTA
jgi:hypothetical protein